jgi:hypothetical protein
LCLSDHPSASVEQVNIISIIIISADKISSIQLKPISTPHYGEVRVHEGAPSLHGGYGDVHHNHHGAMAATTIGCSSAVHIEC